MPGQSKGELSNFWQMQLALAETDHKDFWDEAQATIERYRNDHQAAKRRDSKRFAVLYSNVETLKSALYARTAKPDVRRRYPDFSRPDDKVSRESATVIERGLEYCNDIYDVDTPINAAMHDHLTAGRGVVRVDYEPIFGEQPVFDPYFGMPMIGEDGQPVTEETIVDQNLVTKHVFWRDFLHSPCRSWAECWWIAFRHKMTRDDLRENEFDDAESVPLNWAPDVDTKRDIPEDLKRAEVWEIWDKASKKRIWIVKGYPKALRVDADPYELEGFWPTPGPICAIPDTETMIPIPEFLMYKDQADDLDEITARISRLTRALKRRGVYDQSVPELRRLARAGDNEFIPVENYAALAQKGGLAMSFQTEDVAMVAQVLLGLYQQRDMLLAAIREITGISDIMRGESDPRETMGAQRIKAQFGSQRLRRRQRQVQAWIRDLYRIKAEMIAEHFEPEKLSAISGIEVTPEMVELLRADHLRGYRIDVETDSTVFEDAEREKMQSMELLTSVGGFLQQAVPAVQQTPQIGPLLFDMLAMGVRSFKNGRQLEDGIEQLKTQLTQAIETGQVRGQNPDDGGAQAAQAQGQADQQTIQMEAQAKIQTAAQVAQIKAQERMALSQIGVQEHEAKKSIDQAAREREAMTEYQLKMGLASIQGSGGGALN
jgi:hypothetical protein